MSSNSYYSGPPTDHFDGTRFFNPGGREPAGLRAILGWRLKGRSAPWPERFDSPLPRDRPPVRVEGAGLRLVHIGHAGFLLQTAGCNVLIDPVYSRRCSPVSFTGPERHAEPGIAFEDLPPIDAVCLTHSHYDHLDNATVLRLHERDRPRFVVPLGVDAILKHWAGAIAAEAFDWLDEVRRGEGLDLVFEPTHHWSARGLFDRRKTLWASFAFRTPAGLYYHVGDTGFHEGRNFEAARQRHGPARLAVLPIGAYEPREVMAGQHQDPEEAVKAARLLEAETAIGSHWGYFKLTDEPIEEPAERLEQACRTLGTPPEHFLAARPGLVFELPHRLRP